MKFTVEQLKDLTPEDIEISEAGPRTPILAALQLSIAQTYLLEMIKAEGGHGPASKAFEHVKNALELLDDYETETEH